MRMPLYLLSVGMFALGLDAYVVAGLLPDIAQTFATTPAAAGLAVAAFTASYALSAPVFATALAGRPARSVLSAALAIFVLANAASALAPTFELFLVARAAAGAGAGLYSPLAAASAAFLVENQRRGRMLGFILGGMSLGTVIGVPSGLLIAEQLGWQATLWFVSVLGAIALAGLRVFFPSITPPPPPSLAERIALLRQPTILAVVAVTFLISVASLGLYTFVAPLLAEAGHAGSMPTFLWAWGLGGIAGSFSVGHLIDRVRNGRPVIAALTIVLALTFAVLPAALQVGFVAVVPFFVWGMLGWASQAPQQHSLIEDHPNHGAAAVALNSSANYLGSAVGALAGSFLLTHLAAPHMLPLAAAGCVLAALVIHLAMMAIRREMVNEEIGR